MSLSLFPGGPDELAGLPDYSGLSRQINQAMQTPTDLLNGMAAATQASLAAFGSASWTRALASQLRAERALGPDFNNSLLRLTQLSSPLAVARDLARQTAGAGAGAGIIGFTSQNPAQLVRAIQAREREGRFVSDPTRSLEWVTRALTPNWMISAAQGGSLAGLDGSDWLRNLSRHLVPASLPVAAPASLAGLVGNVRSLVRQLEANADTEAATDVEEAPVRAEIVHEATHVADVIEALQQRIEGIEVQPLATAADVQRLRSDLVGMMGQLHQHLDQRAELLALPEADRPGGWRYWVVVVVPAIIAYFSLLALLNGLFFPHPDPVSPPPASPARVEMLREAAALRQEIGQQVAATALRLDSAVVYYAPSARVLAAPHRQARVVGRVERGQVLPILRTVGPYYYVQFLAGPAAGKDVVAGWVHKRALRRTRPR